MAGAFADKETVEYTIGTETMKDICKNNGLDYDFCKDAIIKLNPTRFTKESDFSSLMVGWKIKLPKTNQDAADILGVALPDSLKPKAAGDTQIYTVVKNDTLIGICDKLKLDYGKCKAAIMKLNGWSDYNLLTLHVGDKVKLPKSDADAAVIAASATGTATGTTTATGGIFLPTDGAVAAYMVPHVVKTGETLYGICVENGIDFNKYINLIMKASGLKSATIYTGDIVFIPSASATSGATSVITHIVKGGETVYGICQTYGTSTTSIPAMFCICPRAARPRPAARRPAARPPAAAAADPAAATRPLRPILRSRRRTSRPRKAPCTTSRSTRSPRTTRSTTC